MKLAYWKSPEGNFGDDLNDWFWDRLAPGLVDQDDTSILYGIGTLLGEWFDRTLPAHARRFVVGSGAGSKGALPTLDDRWHVYGVRGPLSAAYLGLGADKVLTDPAMLIALFPEYHAQGSRSGVGFMPHIWSLDEWDWEGICRRLGLTFLDPRGDSRALVTQIGGLERLLTEAMHGAIVADALRTPWTAVAISPRFEAAKWADWASTVGVDVQLHRLPALRRGAAGRMLGMTHAARRLIVNLGIRPGFVPERTSSRADVLIAERRLLRLADAGPTQLSDHDRMMAAVNRTLDAVHRMRDEIGRSAGTVSKSAR